MRVRNIIIFITLFFSTQLYSQDESIFDKVQLPGFIDTLFIDRNINNWSIRVYGSYRNNIFHLKNKDEKLLYTPNNPYGIGVGIATKKLLLDVGINLKVKSKEPTERFDLHASLMLHKHQIDYFFQSYQGYNINNDIELSDDFRKDISSLSTGISYMYIFNANEYSVAAMKSGLSRQKKAAISFGLGAFVFMNRMSADSSVIPFELSTRFNNEAQIKDILGIGGGVLGRFNATVPFMKKFFASLSITGGVGLLYKDVETESISYRPSNPVIYQYGLGSVIGYNGKRFYVNLLIGLTYYESDLDFGNKVYYNTTNSKLSIGYKLKRKSNK